MCRYNDHLHISFEKSPREESNTQIHQSLDPVKQRKQPSQSRPTTNTWCSLGADQVEQGEL